MCKQERVTQAGTQVGAQAERDARPEDQPYLRAENEDDDGYDPYSDRPAAREPLFEADPWA